MIIPSEFIKLWLDKSKAIIDHQGVHLADGITDNHELFIALYEFYLIECKRTNSVRIRKKQFYPLFREIVYKKHPYQFNFQEFLDAFNINHSNKEKSIPIRTLFNKFNEWRTSNGHAPITICTFGKWMSKYGFHGYRKWIDHSKSYRAYRINQESML